jgi:adenine-specific DNA-methyltransferase
MAGRQRAQPSGQHGALPVEDYRHAGATRPNNPPAAIAAEGRTPPAPRTTYAYSPRLDPALRADPSGRADALPLLLEKATREKLTAAEAALLAEALRRHEPWLEWAGKRETPGFAVDPVALHIHERVSTQAILRAAARQDVTRDLFADSALSYAQAVKFYQHDVDWANRLILGDSLQVMASLAQRENLAGKVQMIFLDPPYGIRFGSNFQPETGKRTVSDRDTDLTREPEMVRAYRDTWRLGVHSYLTYLRDRLVVARTLLSDSGSIFVQIGDENVHRVRALMDEVFGVQSFAAMLVFTKSAGGLRSVSRVGITTDFILWYQIGGERSKYFPLYEPKSDPVDSGYTALRLPDGSERAMTKNERLGVDSLPTAAQPFMSVLMTKPGPGSKYDVEYGGRSYHAGQRWWGTTPEGMQRVIRSGRVVATEGSIRFRNNFADYPYRAITNLWSGFGGASDPVYVVQTNAEIIQRCMLMTTEPGDIVLDPTCGSGTTAAVAEKWGRRWITIDTSRVAVAIARQRMLSQADREPKIGEFEGAAACCDPHRPYAVG